MNIKFIKEIACAGMHYPFPTAVSYPAENYKYLDLVLKNFGGYGYDIIKASSNGRDVDAQLFTGHWKEEKTSIVQDNPKPFHQYWVNEF